MEAQLADELLSACRTAIGDDLRSIVLFTEDDHEQVYLREDLEADADLVGFVEAERLGFRAQGTYRNSELGAYEFTIRVFEHGYIARAIVGEHGVFVTTDEMTMNRFEEVGEAIRRVLRAHA